MSGMLLMIIGCLSLVILFFGIAFHFLIHVSDFGESSLDMTEEEYKQACDDYNAELKMIQYEKSINR